ncbi:MAG: zf-HC2 domain-containing protein [Treponema sp.]|nr:zf-HC2 domain-containing protein [Treponema sp.]
MFTCPEKDIHSIYIDGELPENFSREYEAHIGSCEKCRAELEKIRAMRALLAKDSASLDLDKDFMEKSFERLQSRMRFKKIVSQGEDKSFIVPMRRTFIPMAAAAAAVFAILLPQKMNSSHNTNMAAQDLPIISRAQEITPIAKSDVIVEDGIQNVALQNATERNSLAVAGNVKPLELKASKFEMLKSEESEENDENGMKIRLTELSNLGSISAENVSFGQFRAPDFLK